MGQQPGFNLGNFGGGGGQLGGALGGSGKLGNIISALSQRPGGGMPGGVATPAVMPNGGGFDMNALRAAIQGAGPSRAGSAQDLRNPNAGMRAGAGGGAGWGPGYAPGMDPSQASPVGGSGWAALNPNFGAPNPNMGGSLGNVNPNAGQLDGNWGSVSAPRPAQAATWPNGWGPQGDNRLAEAYGSPGTGALAPGSTRPSPQFAQSAGAPSGRNQIAVQGNPAARRALGY